MLKTDTQMDLTGFGVPKLSKPGLGSDRGLRDDLAPGGLGKSARRERETDIGLHWNKHDMTT